MAEKQKRDKQYDLSPSKSKQLRKEGWKGDYKGSKDWYNYMKGIHDEESSGKKTVREAKSMKDYRTRGGTNKEQVFSHGAYVYYRDKFPKKVSTTSKASDGLKKKAVTKKTAKRLAGK